jgi:hypothetical protein
VGEDLKPEHIIGKTIDKVDIYDNSVEITFKDGSEAIICINFYGYGGARLDNNYYPNESK